MPVPRFLRFTLAAALVTGGACAGLADPTATALDLASDPATSESNRTGNSGSDGTGGTTGSAAASAANPILLVIDEESIDNGNPPNNFSDVDANDQLATLGLRRQLAFFAANTGRTIDLFTGQVGDEGWFALRTIPNSWRRTGPSSNGARNYFVAGPHLGGPRPDDDREVLLDKVPDVTPLRATGLAMLIGHTVCAVVYDSDVSINYSPLLGNLQGANLGIVAFEVLRVTRRRDGSTSDLPRVTIRIADANRICERPFSLFANAPVPRSSSEPFDIAPPSNPAAARLAVAP